MINNAGVLIFHYFILASTAPGDLIPSLILPGQPLSYITFRIFTYVCQSHILLFLSNYKIGHYMKVRLFLLIDSSSKTY